MQWQLSQPNMLVFPSVQAMAADKSDTWFAARNMKKVSA